MAVPKASIRPPIVLPSLAMVMNSSPGRPSSIQAHGDVTLVAGDVELVGDAIAAYRGGVRGGGLAALAAGGGGALWPSVLVVSGWLSFEPSR